MCMSTCGLVMACQKYGENPARAALVKQCFFKEATARPRSAGNSEF